MMNYIRDWKRECQNLLGALFVAIVIGLLFLRRPDSLKGSGAKLALLFLLILRAAFEAIAGIAAFFIDRPVFYRYARISLRNYVSHRTVSLTPIG